MIWLTNKSFLVLSPQYLKPDVLGLYRKLTRRRKDRLILIYLLPLGVRVSFLNKAEE